MAFHFRLLALPAVPVTMTLALIASPMQAQASAPISVTFATHGTVCYGSQDPRVGIHRFLSNTFGEETQEKFASLSCSPGTPGAKAVNPNVLIDPLATRPAVTSLNPGAGPDTGGSAVVITGRGFTGASAVTFGGVPAASFTVESGTRITAKAPASLPGSVEVQVLNRAGISAVVKADRFAYRKVIAYVAGGSGVIPVNAATGQPGAAIKVAGAWAIAITPNGATAYVIRRGSGSVTPIRVATGAVLRAIGVGSGPDAIAITPDGAWAYVVNGASGTVTKILVATGAVLAEMRVGSHPDAIAITPDGASAYVVNGGSGTVTPIQLATGAVLKAIRVGNHPDAIAITPNGKTAYVASSAGTVTPIKTATGKAAKAIRAGSGPTALAITPDDSTIYVADYGTARAHGDTVTLIRAATGKVVKSIRVGSGPDAISIAPGGMVAFVLNFFSGTTIPINTATGAVGRAIKVGKGPSCLAIAQ